MHGCMEGVNMDVNVSYNNVSCQHTNVFRKIKFRIFKIYIDGRLTNGIAQKIYMSGPIVD